MAAAERRHTRAIAWDHTGDGVVPYRATIDGRVHEIRINDFPAEPLYTLLVDGEEVEDLDDWPVAWTRPATPQALLDKLANAKRT
ncbi:MAG: hypothetical protein H0T79_14965 [Deltaproteobacteria bacterium]|nr:hypothetical protein [Deltaproteobacteria bacterium]